MTVFLLDKQPAHSNAPALWFIFDDQRLLVCPAAEYGGLPLLSDHAHLPIMDAHYIGLFHATPCYAAKLKNDEALPPGWQTVSLRALYQQLGDELFVAAGTAKQILTWYHDHQFCGRCGAKTDLAKHERAMLCPRCHLSFYPRISPAVIVLVTHGEQLLLARSPHFSAGVYSTLAGFVEVGESAEQTIHREIKEEVGVEVGNIRYFGSQAWPFPHSLMLGFFADYVSGELKIDGTEIEDARWFALDALPSLPHKASIAYDLIQCFLQGRRRG